MMKQVKLSDDVHRDMAMIKAKKGFKTYNETIVYLIENLNHYLQEK